MNDFPKITIITPSFNQVSFLERTIRSVLDQEYENLEYIIIDGGSTDGSVDIIRKYADQLAWWQSEPDLGQAHAINQGLLRATGEWVAWQNSDDIYFPGAFKELVYVATKNPDAMMIIGDMMMIDGCDNPIRDVRYVTPSYKSLLAEGMLIANQAAFWRRSIQERVGLLDQGYHCSFDYDWFLRLTQSAKGIHVNNIWGALRLHGEPKTSLLAIQFHEENKKILAGRELSACQKFAYKCRRFMLMIIGGQFTYVVRGLWSRLFRQCMGAD